MVREMIDHCLRPIHDQTLVLRVRVFKSGVANDDELAALKAARKLEGMMKNLKDAGLNFWAVDDDEVFRLCATIVEASGASDPSTCRRVLDEFSTVRRVWATTCEISPGALFIFLDHPLRLLPELASLCASYLPSLNFYVPCR